MTKICSIIKLNDTIYFKRTFQSGFDHIKYIDNGTNHIFDMVVDAMTTHDWYQRLGLSLKDTMELDFSEFRKLDEKMTALKQKQLLQANAAASNINQQLNRL